MSEERPFEDIREETKHFVNTFCEFHHAFPDENQSIVDQIVKQVTEAEKTDKIYVPGEKGQDLIWTFKRQGTKVFKRVFHPGHGERPVGADFALYKITSANELGITAVQVKRNRNKPFFEFTERDLTQRNRLARWWGSAYYLMVDETHIPPCYLFLHASELENLIEQTGKHVPVKIPNDKIEIFGRDSGSFYDLFYNCRRGSRYAPDNYGARIAYYTRRSKRAIVEVATKAAAEL